MVPNEDFEFVKYLTYWYKDGRQEDISSGFFHTLQWVVQAQAENSN